MTGTRLERGAAAQAEGRFTDEIVSVHRPGRKGDTGDRDEHTRPDTSMEVLARLHPIRAPEKAAQLGLRLWVPKTSASGRMLR